jgi:hypothetical protein
MTEIISPQPPTLEDLRARRDEILEIAARRGARNVRVFGSVARGDADGRSDVDFLVDMDRGRSLFDMGGLLMDLSELLECEVDVATENVFPAIRAGHPEIPWQEAVGTRNILRDDGLWERGGCLGQLRPRAHITAYSSV